jgi:hypothetical protein
MKNKLALAHFRRLAVLASAVILSTQAAPSETLRWKDLTNYLRGKVVTITTKDGRSLKGKDFAVRPDSILITDGAPVSVPRQAVLSLHWESIHEAETHKLGRMLSHGYRHSFGLLGTPAGPFALVELPAITAWGAAAAPFCILGDLLSEHPQSSGDISILPDPVEVSK